MTPTPDTHLTLANAGDAIESTVNGWACFMDASKPYEFAAAVIALQNAVSDLASWHPRYDSDTGRILGGDE